MVNLPRRREEIEVEIPDTDATLYLEPLSDDQRVRVIRTLAQNADLFESRNGRPEIVDKGGGHYEIVQSGEVVEKVRGQEKAERVRDELAGLMEVTIDTSALEKVQAIAPLFDLVESNLRRVEGVEIEGEPFDVSRSDHLASIPMAWKGRAVNELVDEAFMDEETGKGSGGPVGPPTRATTPQEA